MHPFQRREVYGLFSPPVKANESIRAVNAFVFFRCPFYILFVVVFTFLLCLHPADAVWGASLRNKLVFAFLALLVLLFCGVQVYGQGTDLGTIRGTVTDASGAAIPNAAVTITDALTNTARQTQTNAQGHYEMFGLRAGTYRVVITAPGMDKKEINDIVLN